jgi:glucose/arabinose dehydrogenase
MLNTFRIFGLCSLGAITISFFLGSLGFNSVFAQAQFNDPSVTAQVMVDGLASPTGFAFLDKDNILLLEKDGNVRLISNGQLQPEPVLQVEGIQSNNERGLLGIVVGDADDGGGDNGKVYLYVTENSAQVEGVPTEGDVRNRVYSYTWDGTSLTSPQLLLDLPAAPGTNHQGGKLKIGPDNQLYAVVGELQREGQLQNIQGGPASDDSGVILRVNPIDGSASADNPFISGGGEASKYYAYGIRNSYGIDFDPVTGKLWDAENGEDVFDEINLVEPGLNSGWKLVMGPIAANTGVSESDLVNIPGSQYADPVFSWAESRGITDIEFFNSTTFGSNYENGIFVGDITTGTLFYFAPNADRTGLNLENDPLLSDLVADSDDETSAVTFGTGFTGITDIETSPDGYLYVLTFDRANEGPGSLLRITPSSVSADNAAGLQNGTGISESGLVGGNSVESGTGDVVTGDQGQEAGTSADNGPEDESDSSENEED